MNSGAPKAAKYEAQKHTHEVYVETVSRTFTHQHPPAEYHNHPVRQLYIPGWPKEDSSMDEVLFP